MLDKIEDYLKKNRNLKLKFSKTQSKTKDLTEKIIYEINESHNLNINYYFEGEYLILYLKSKLSEYKIDQKKEVSEYKELTLYEKTKLGIIERNNENKLNKKSIIIIMITYIFLYHIFYIDTYAKDFALNLLNINFKFFFTIIFFVILAYSFVISIFSLKEKRIIYIFPIGLLAILYSVLSLFSNHIKDFLEIKNFSSIQFDYLILFLSLIIIVFVRNFNVLLSNLKYIIYLICFFLVVNVIYTFFKINILEIFINKNIVNIKVLLTYLLIALSIGFSIIAIRKEHAGFREEMLVKDFSKIIVKIKTYILYIENSLNSFIDYYQIQNSTHNKNVALYSGILLFFIFTFFKQNLIDDYYSFYQSKNEGYCTNLDYNDIIIKEPLSNKKVIVDLKLKYKNYKDNKERFVYEKCD